MVRIHPNVLKLRNARRKRPRALRSDIIHAPRSVGLSNIPDDAQALFEYRTRGKIPYTKMLHNILPGFKTNEAGRLPHDGHWVISNPSELEKVHHIIEEQEVCDYFVCYQGRITKTSVVIVYNRKKTRNYFYKVCYLGAHTYIQKSIEYSNHEDALELVRAHKVDWIEHFPLHSLTLVLPRRR